MHPIFNPNKLWDFNCINKIEDVVCVFREMLMFQPMPSVILFNKLLKRVVRMKENFVALHIFKEMRKVCIPLDEYSLTIAIDCFVFMNRLDLGFAVLGAFYKCGYQPNVTTFSTLAEFFLEKLLKEKHCIPDEVMYITVFDGFCKAGHTSDATRYLRFLEERGKPSIYAYSSIIDSLCKDGEVNACVILVEVDKFLQEMFAQNIIPDLITYITLIHSFCLDGNVEVAMEVLELMKQRRVCPDIITYNSLIDGYCMRGDAQCKKNITISFGFKP
ncbi:hypothetical protein ACJIZ3_017391 [Penstemon smallii]|uniref:Pentatricopeptide repeat-containing protein n=1 Tax=Penstemon smallii TaxID=265156 RepID=A0ABD3SVE8_9LAMI